MVTDPHSNASATTAMPFRDYLGVTFRPLFWRSLGLCTAVFLAAVVAGNVLRAGSHWWQGIFTRTWPDLFLMAVALLGVAAAGLELAIMTAYFRWRRAQPS